MCLFLVGDYSLGEAFKIIICIYFHLCDTCIWNIVSAS